jgi:stage V sporulation protein SpoVS
VGAHSKPQKKKKKKSVRATGFATIQQAVKTFAKLVSRMWRNPGDQELKEEESVVFAIDEKQEKESAIEWKSRKISCG